MGWLWASPSPPKPSTPVQQQATSPPAATGPDEPVDPEIQKFLDLFKTELSASSPPTEPTAAAAKTADAAPSSSKPASSWLGLRASPPPDTPQDRTTSPSSSISSSTATTPFSEAPASQTPLLDPLSEALLPTDMSCRQAFDLAWGCNSIGGQWNAVYRYGSMRSCSEQWDDFWFCMRTRSHSSQSRQAMIREHYRAKERRKYGPGMPSSEDVWQSREVKVAPGASFSEAMDAPDLDDDEWRRMEADRRRRIRQSLGFDQAPS